MDRTYRQTFLKFTNTKDPAAPAQNTSTLAAKRQSRHGAKPPPDLPAEIWEQIFCQMKTFALKKFRLVCRGWALLAERRLYETIYLNIYESSWAGLLAACNSHHATSVRRLVWNPIQIPQRSVDAATWHAQYSNILRGLKQHQILSLYDVFLQARRGHVIRTTALKRVAEVLCNLRNCHEVVVEDENDFQYSCQDAYTVKGVQQYLVILQRPSNWGIRPSSWRDDWYYEPHNNLPLSQQHGGVQLEGVMDLFTLIPVSDSIVSLRVDLWYHRWDFLHDDKGFKAIGQQHIKNVHLRIKHFGEASRWSEFVNIPSLSQGILNSFDWLRYFPQVREVYYSPIFCEPGEEFFSYILRRAEPFDTDDNEGNHSDEERHEGSTSRRDEIRNEVMQKRESLHMPDDLPAGMTSSMAHCLSADLQLGFTTLPNLRTITFSNCLLGMRALLCWLCCQPQVPTCSLQLRFRGTTILSQFRDTDFFESLRQLNVSIEYDHEQTFYYRRGVTGLSNANHRGLPTMSLEISQDHYWVEMDSFSMEGHKPRVGEEPQQMIPCPDTKTYKGYKSDIVCRPNKLTTYQSDVLSFHADYCIVRNISEEDTTDRWCYILHESESDSERHLSRLRDSKNVTRVIPLCQLQIRSGRYYDSYGYDEYYDFLPNDLETAENSIYYESDNARRRKEYCRWKEGIEQQALLKTYEFHLLGLDVLIRCGRLSPREMSNVCLVSPIQREGAMVMVCEP